MSERTWVLVDASYFAYRALHSVADLELDDVPTGVVFGFFHQLRTTCLDTLVRSNRVAFFCDSRSSLRAKAAPEYKRKRREVRTEEEVKRVRAMRKQLDDLTDHILPDCGFPVYQQEGLESDDLLAAAAADLEEAGKVERDPRRRAVIITSDGDLLQCVTRRVHWFDPQRGIYHDPASFRAKVGLPPRQWGEVKAIGGCRTDCVRGVPGVGETTAVRYLRGELPPRLKAHQAIVSPQGRRTVERNRKLVVLPHEATRFPGLREPSPSAGAFFRHCRRYGIESILSNKKAWRSFLGGAQFRTRRAGES